MRKSNDHYATCAYCGNKVYSGAGEAARIVMDEFGINHYHVDCYTQFRKSIAVMRWMEEEIDHVAERGIE